MPHVIVEYSGNLAPLDELDVLKTINQSLVDTQLFNALDIKSRISVNHCFLVGLGERAQGYIHIQVRILSGRADEQKQMLSQRVGQAIAALNLQSQQDLPIQLSVELIDMPKAHYYKDVL